MLPLILNPHALKAGLIGAGEGLARRQALLGAAGVEVRLLPPDAPDADLKGLQLLFVAGLLPQAASGLAGRARTLGVLVNVEDEPPLCDFHVPAIVRRGDLLLTASTAGKVPGLSRLLRQHLADQFGPEWTGRLRELSVARARWRAEGLSPADVSQMVAARVESEGWL